MKKKTRKSKSSNHSLTVLIVLGVVSFILTLYAFAKNDQNLSDKTVDVPTLVQTAETQQTSMENLIGTTQQTQETQQTQQSQEMSSSMETMQMDHNTMVKAEAGSIAANDRVKFKIDHFKKLDTQPLEFEVFDENKKALKSADLKTVHEKNMHFIVVSADLKEYLHLHPTFENGKWKTLAYLPTPGTYYAYVDIAPVNGNPVVLRSELIVRNPTSGSIVYPSTTKDLTVSNGNYDVKLDLQHPNILQQTLFSYKVSAKNSTNFQLQPYLGALGHNIVFRHGDVDSFTHVHPLTSTNNADHLVEFLTTFSKAGIYTAFVQF